MFNRHQKSGWGWSLVTECLQSPCHTLGLFNLHIGDWYAIKHLLNYLCKTLIIATFKACHRHRALRQALNEAWKCVICFSFTSWCCQESPPLAWKATAYLVPNATYLWQHSLYETWLNFPVKVTICMAGLHRKGGSRSQGRAPIPALQAKSAFSGTFWEAVSGCPC